MCKAESVNGMLKPPASFLTHDLLRATMPVLSPLTQATHVSQSGMPLK